MCVTCVQYTQIKQNSRKLGTHTQLYQSYPYPSLVRQGDAKPRHQLPVCYFRFYLVIFRAASPQISQWTESSLQRPRVVSTQQTQNICKILKTLALYKYYTNLLCLLGSLFNPYNAGIILYRIWGPTVF